MKTKILLFAALLAIGCQKKDCYQCKATTSVNGQPQGPSHYSLCDATKGEMEAHVQNSTFTARETSPGKWWSQTVTCEKQ